MQHYVTALFRPALAPWDVVVRAAVMYVFVQLVFRVLGRKELGRWGLPDVVLLFLLGTSVRMTIVGSDASLTSAMIGLATIACLDWIQSWVTAHSERWADILEGPLRQLVRDGQVQRDVLRRSRLSESELLAYVRERGGEAIRDVKDAFIERSGKVTVVLRPPGERGSSSGHRRRSTVT